MRLQKRRVLVSGVLSLGATLALAGCGAGQITQTDTMLPAVDGALATVGKISLRNAGLANTNSCQQAYAPGSDAPLTLTITNDSAQDDELTEVSSPNAASAAITGQQTVRARNTLVVGAAAAGASGSAATGGGAAAELGHADVVLNGVKQVVWPGQLVPVTFVFRDAGPVTMQLPVKAPTKELPDCQTAPQPAVTGH